MANIIDFNQSDVVVAEDNGTFFDDFDFDQKKVEEPQNKVVKKYMGEDGVYHLTLSYFGNEFDFVPARLRDQRVMYILGKLSKTDDLETLADYQTRMFDLLLGDEALDIMDMVASLNSAGGVLTEEAFSEFMTFLFESSEAKN